MDGIATSKDMAKCIHKYDCYSPCHIFTLVLDIRGGMYWHEQGASIV